VVHTLVDAQLRHALTESLRKHHVPAVDLVGKAIGLIEQRLGQKPLGSPGRYRALHEDYFNRIDALEFAIDHDDGRRPHELPLAEIVLVGVSRVGKTPLSMYLATHGWKVANVPLAQNVKPPHTLFEIDQRHVFGLSVDPGQLLELRHKRGKQIGMGHGKYQEPSEIYEELQFADRLFRRGQFRVVDMTDKPIEEAAQEIISKTLGLSCVVESGASDSTITMHV
jgi:hypothetical protein